MKTQQSPPRPVHKTSVDKLRETHEKELTLKNIRIVKRKRRQGLTLFKINGLNVWARTKKAAESKAASKLKKWQASFKRTK